MTARNRRRSESPRRIWLREFVASSLGKEVEHRFAAAWGASMSTVLIGGAQVIRQLAPTAAVMQIVDMWIVARWVCTSSFPSSNFYGVYNVSRARVWYTAVFRLNSVSSVMILVGRTGPTLRQGRSNPTSVSSVLWL